MSAPAAVAQAFQARQGVLRPSSLLYGHLGFAYGRPAKHRAVLEGMKSAAASALWGYEARGDAVPQKGELSMILDGAGAPKSVIETTEVRIVPFNQVDASHAHAEGDRSLAHWRDVHERFWREYSEDPRGFEPDMPVVCEQFRVIYPVSA